MKKLLSFCLVLALLTAVVFTVPGSAADDVLTVTANGENPRSYQVGDEIVFFVGLDTGSAEILNGQGYVTYDTEHLELVEHKATVLKKTNMQAYSFPIEIYLGNLIFNPGTPGLIRYNFSSSEGVGTFTSFDQHFVRFHFRVKAAGTADISNTISVMCDYDENYIYHFDAVVEGVQAAFESRTMLATVTAGDLNSDGAVNLRDAVILDRYLAGWDGYRDRLVDRDAADIDRDGVIGHADALILDRYVAGWKTYGEKIVEVTR